MNTTEKTDEIVRSHLELEDRIRRRAHEIYLSGRNGSELEDWLQAEREILGDSGKSPAQERATAVGYAGRPDREDFESLGEA